MSPRVPVSDAADFPFFSEVFVVFVFFETRVENSVDKQDFGPLRFVFRNARHRFRVLREVCYPSVGVYFLQPPLYGSLPLPFPNSPTAVFLVRVPDPGESPLITDLQPFEDCFSCHADGNTQVENAEDNVEAHENSRGGIIGNDVTESDGFDRDDGEVQPVNEVEIDQEGVNQGAKGNVYHEKHYDDQK